MSTIIPEMASLGVDPSSLALSAPPTGPANLQRALSFEREKVCIFINSFFFFIRRKESSTQRENCIGIAKYDDDMTNICLQMRRPFLHSANKQSKTINSRNVLTQLDKLTVLSRRRSLARERERKKVERQACVSRNTRMRKNL